MADVKAAIESVLRQEDATLSGVIASTPGDTGGKTRFGLASRWHPDLLATTFYTTMSTADALQLATATLTKSYADGMGIAEMNDQALATKVLSFGVNAGVRQGVLALQKAINAVFSGSNFDVAVDGVCGAWTIAAANRCMAQSLLNSFRLRMIEYYNADCKRNASQLKFLVGWIDRAMA